MPGKGYGGGRSRGRDRNLTGKFPVVALPAGIYQPWNIFQPACIWDKNKLYSITGILGVIGTAILLVILYTKGYLTREGFTRLGDVQIFYDADIATVAISCSLLAVILSFYYLVTQTIQAQWFTKSYCFLSKQLTNIYFIQWVIIPWTAFCLPRPTEKASMWWSVLLTVIITGASTALSALYSKLKSRKKSAE